MSSQPAQVFERRFPNQFAELSRVTTEALAFIDSSGIGPPGIYRVNLAIEELATNILKYGYGGDPAIHEILLRVELRPGAVLVTLEDDGQPFNPLEAPAPDVHLAPEQRAVGGLGIHLVRRLVDEMTYERCGQRNRLTVRIGL